MNIESRVTCKRIITLLCSIGTIVGYSYLLGGVGGYLFGEGRPFTALLGFVGGSILAAVAILVWRSYMVDIGKLEKMESEEKKNL